MGPGMGIKGTFHWTLQKLADLSSFVNAPQCSVLVEEEISGII